MTRHYPDLGNASDWSCRVGNLIQPIRSTTHADQVVTRHQYGISALVSQTSFGGETSGSVAKCRLFSQATPFHVFYLVWWGVKRAWLFKSWLSVIRSRPCCYGIGNGLLFSFPCSIGLKNR